MSFLEWVSLRAELEDHQRAGPRECTCPVAHPCSPCIHFTSGFPGSSGTMRWCASYTHAVLVASRQSTGMSSSPYSTGPAHVPWEADSTPSFLTFAGPRLENVAKWKRVLHYCQLPLTTQGTGPFQCFWFLLPLKVYWVIISKGCCFLILSGKQLKDCFWRLIVAVYLRSSLSSPSNLTNKLPNYGNALKHSPFLSLSAREK